VAVPDRIVSYGKAVNIHHDKTFILQDAALCEQPADLRRRSRTLGSAKYIVFGSFATVTAIMLPTLLVLVGIGMSRQGGDVAMNGALATLIAIIIGFFIIRRVLAIPLLGSSGYFTLTFVIDFLAVAIALRWFHIDFSAPQFFLGLVIIAAMVEVFFYARHQWGSGRIAVVPGASNLAKLPERVIGKVKFTMLTSTAGINFDFDAVIADLSSNVEPKWERFIAMSALRGIPVYDVKQFNESITGRAAVDHLRENTLGAVIPSLIYPPFKRGLDVLLAMCLLPFIALILGICAVLIKLETAGPFLYRQSRAGFGGEPFTIFKLRTMTDNNDGASYTLDDDERITRIGHFLRHYRIDELPQIINILRGEMSWIGPRPEAMPLARWYEREVPFYIYRHIVQPGITGWAQVHQGNVAAVDAARLKLEYDFYYIKHFSFWLDVVVVIKTLHVIWTRFGSR
jgi:lipopolysaccharide/colanic/teichoic acid biosynthesis glycosyltransferase